MMFSVIVPVYNAAKYLRPCLDSVLNQTERDWECICVDDGSTDASGAILDEYAEKDARFKVVHQKNAGVSAARNKALSMMRGEWITWLDADDMYAHDRLEVAHRIVDKEHPELIRFRTYFGGDRECDWPLKSGRNMSYDVMSGADAKQWGWQVLAPVGMVWTWVAQRKLLEGVCFPVGMRTKEDSIFCGMIANRIEKVVQSECQAYFYRQLPTSAIHSVRRADDCLRLLTAVKALYESQLPLREKIGERVYDAMVRWLRVHSESDIIDWVTRRHGERCRAREVHALYRDLKSVGIFDCPTILQWRYRLPMWWWDKTGQIWLIEVADALISVMRRVMGAMKMPRMRAEK